MLAMMRIDADQQTVANACGMSASAISLMCAGHRRPDPDTMRRVVHAALWDRSDRARIMIGHLRDEMSRADWERHRDIAIYARPTPNHDRARAARAALVMLADHAHIDEVGELLIDLAELVQRGCDADETTEPEPLQAVAESPAPYESPKRLSVSKKNSGKK